MDVAAVRTRGREESRRAGRGQRHRHTNRRRDRGALRSGM